MEAGKDWLKTCALRELSFSSVCLKGLEESRGCSCSWRLCRRAERSGEKIKMGTGSESV